MKSSTLCNLLMRSMQLPEGSDLVILIGNGNERDNAEALHNWIAENLECPDQDLVCVLLPLLIKRLQLLLQQGDNGC